MAELLYWVGIDCTAVSNKMSMNLQINDEEEKVK